MRNLDTSTIPPDLSKRMLEVGKIEWGAVSGKTDEQHIADFSDSLRITRKHHSLEPGNHALNGCYLAGTETVVCHTGTSPNSPTHAKIIAGLWNSTIDALQAEKAPAPALHDVAWNAYVDLSMNSDLSTRDVLNRVADAVAAAIS